MTSPENLRVAVLGAGSWGTALAKHAADIGHQVVLWARREELVESIRASLENRQYLPGFKLPSTLRATNSLEEALKNANLVFSVIPSQETRGVWKEAAQYLSGDAAVLCASKGIETQTLDLMSTVFEEILPSVPISFVGGPSFAKEVAGHLPTAIVVASKHEQAAKQAQAALSCDWLRVYISSDVVGVEAGGALKNIVAIACGCSDGLGLGHNTRSALITRGLAEITRLAVVLGAEPATLAGLAGLGDLVLTCTGDLSRNRRLGMGLGKGKKLAAILGEMGQVAEGVMTARATRDLAAKLGVDMPITSEVCRMLFEELPAREVVSSLMRRTLKAE